MLVPCCQLCTEQLCLLYIYLVSNKAKELAVSVSAILLIPIMACVPVSQMAYTVYILCYIYDVREGCEGLWSTAGFIFFFCRALPICVVIFAATSRTNTCIVNDIFLRFVADQFKPCTVLRNGFPCELKTTLLPTSEQLIVR